jgi:hypothetical protein
MHLFEGRDVSVDVERQKVTFRLAPELYAKAIAELYLSGVGVLFDVLHSHKWFAFKRLAAQSLAGFQLAGQYVKLSSANGLQGRVSFKTWEEAERYAEAARRELEKLGIYAAPKIVLRGIYYQVVFDEKTLRKLAEVDETVKLAIERLEALFTPHIAAEPIDAARLDAKPERLHESVVKRERYLVLKPRHRRLWIGLCSARGWYCVYEAEADVCDERGQEDAHCKRRGAVFCVGGGWRAPGCRQPPGGQP